MARIFYISIFVYQKKKGIPTSILFTYLIKETRLVLHLTPLKVLDKRRLQPQANAIVSSGSIAVMGGNIVAENICSPLKQTKPDLIKGVSFRFKETLSVADRAFSSKRKYSFSGRDKQTTVSIKYLFYEHHALFLMLDLLIILVSIKDMADFYGFDLFVYCVDNAIFPLIHAVPLKACISEIL
jgi:hypothetical protein